jgi:mono/diheme cytochrome c family protein
MKARTLFLALFIALVLAVLLAGCAGPRSLPVGPTPIPTLIPATQPVSVPGQATPAIFTVQSFPARQPSADLAEPIYRAQCAGCHGDDGGGVVPGARNFRDLDYMRGESPASFYAAIAEGRGQMPSFRDRLTSDERWDAVAYLWRFSTTDESLALGSSIFQANCVACHGEDGTGKVLGAADFSDLRLMASRAPRDFYLTLTQGRGSMPAWQGRLSQDERWAVIDYLRTFTFNTGIARETEPEALATGEVTETACDPAELAKTNPFAWEDESAIASGGEIYSQACAACHGTDGSGNLPAAPDFTTPAFQSTLRQKPGQELCILTLGRGSMPGWRETLSEEQMWQVLTFLGSLAP